MCIFCAAIPVAVSIGAAAKAKQPKRDLSALDTQIDPTAVRPVSLPLGKGTLLVISGLAFGSVTYHAIIAPRLAIW